MAERNEIIRDGYNEIADKYNATRLAREQINIEWLDSLSRYLPSTGVVVDLGCGSGVPITRYFAQRGYDVTGYDLSREMLRLAKSQVPNAQFELASMLEVDREPGSVDLVTSFFAIIHVDREEHAVLFRRVFDWLRPGGAALLSLGADDNPNQYEANWYGSPMTWSHYGAEMNLGMLLNAGFEIAWHEVEPIPGDSHLFVIAQKPVTGLV